MSLSMPKLDRISNEESINKKCNYLNKKNDKFFRNLKGNYIKI